MSDQISEKMARKYYSAGTSGEWAELEDEFIANLKRKGLIKPSKLDEARAWVRENEYARGSEETHRSYATGVRECASHFEAAITEILGECK